MSIVQLALLSAVMTALLVLHAGTAAKVKSTVKPSSAAAASNGSAAAPAAASNDSALASVAAKNGSTVVVDSG